MRVILTTYKSWDDPPGRSFPGFQSPPIFSTQPSLATELSEATSSSSSLFPRHPGDHMRTEAPKTFSVDHIITSATCVGTCGCKCFLFLSRFICMSTHPHCICLFALRATKHLPVLSAWGLGNLFNLSFCHLKDDFEWGIIRGNKLERQDCE